MYFDSIIANAPHEYHIQEYVNFTQWLIIYGAYEQIVNCHIAP